MANYAGTKGVPRAEREHQILDAAVDEFGLHGYANCSVARIADAVGVSKAMIYSYFDSKDGLYLACLHRAGSNLVEQVEAAQSGPPIERTLTTMHAIFVTLEPRRLDWAVLFDPTLPVQSPVHLAAQQYRRKLVAMGAAGAQELLDGTTEEDEKDTSLLTNIWSNTVATAVAWWLDHPDETAESMIARLSRIATTLARPA